MRTTSYLAVLTATLVIASASVSEARGGLPGLPPPPPPVLLPPPGPPSVDIHVNGYLPPPPGVHVYMDAGRPYYIERERRVYIERERPVKYYKHKKKHHREYEYEEHGRKEGHHKHKY